MQSHYEINVSKDGLHFFATAERTGAISRAHVARVYAELVLRFPTREGYDVIVSYYDCGSTVQTAQFRREFYEKDIPVTFA